MAAGQPRTRAHGLARNARARNAGTGNASAGHAPSGHTGADAPRHEPARNGASRGVRGAIHLTRHDERATTMVNTNRWCGLSDRVVLRR